MTGKTLPLGACESVSRRDLAFDLVDGIKIILPFEFELEQYTVVLPASPQPAPLCPTPATMCSACLLIKLYS